MQKFSQKKKKTRIWFQTLKLLFEIIFSGNNSTSIFCYTANLQIVYIRLIKY